MYITESLCCTPETIKNTLKKTNKMSREYFSKYKHDTNYFMCSPTFDYNSLFSNDSVKSKPNR